MSFEQVARLYGNRGRLVHNGVGRQAYLVRLGARVELFSAHPARPGVGYFQVGRADVVEHGFLHDAPR